MSTPANILSEQMLQLNQMYQLQYLLDKNIKNIDLIINGGNGTILTVLNADLFQLAAKYYSDYKKWTVIADANNLVSPLITSSTPMQLVIPKSGQDTGGIRVD